LTQVSTITATEGTAGLRRDVAKDDLYNEPYQARGGLPGR
jgi:hypothetical protein